MSRRSPLALVPTAADDPEAAYVLPDPHTTASLQAQDASDALHSTAGDYLHFPYPALDSAIGGLPKGDLWYVCAFSGDGKTTFLTSAVLDWMEMGKCVYYLGLETTPAILRTHFACKVLGYDAGDLLSGKYLEWENHAAIKQEVRQELRRMSVVEKSADRKLLISEAAYLDVDTIHSEAALAASAGAQVLVVDHVDHLPGTSSLYEASVAVNRALLDVAHTYGLWVIAASQYNNEVVKGNRVLRYVMPQPGYVYLGGHKRQVGSGMIGLYRPLKVSGLDKETMKKFKAGTIESQEVVEPNTMAVGIMKHRLYGNREGSRVYLSVDHGRIKHVSQDLFKSTRIV